MADISILRWFINQLITGGVPPCRMGHNFKPPISTSIWNIGDIGDEISNPDWPSQHPKMLKYRQCRIWVDLDWPVTGNPQNPPKLVVFRRSWRASDGEENHWDAPHLRFQAQNQGLGLFPEFPADGIHWQVVTPRVQVEVDFPAFSIQRPLNIVHNQN